MSVINIDETAFVEAINDNPSLQFSDEKQQARFELGISMLVYGWDALDIAVANQWGGANSAEKRDWISGIVVGLFKENKVVDVILVEETLLYALIDEFDTNVEDDSALVVAADIIKFYDECASLNYSRVEALYTKYLEKQKNGQQDRIVHVHGDEGSSSEDEGCDSEEEDVEMDVEEEEEEEGSIAEPVIDDDGFELVQKKGRRKH